MRRIRQLLPILFIILMLTVAALAIRNELQEYSLQDIWQSITAIPKPRLLTALALTGLGYITITAYDLLGFRYIRRQLSPLKIGFTAFLSYAIGNTVGFTLLSGTAIRYRFYSPWGVPPVDIAKVIAFTHLSFWLGMFSIGGLVFLVEPQSIPQLLNLPLHNTSPLGVGFLLTVGVYLLLSFWIRKPLRIRGEEFVLPSVPLFLGLIGVTIVDWGAASGVLYALLPDMPLSYLKFFGLYVLAMVAGIVSTVPGGLGVFETVILLLRPANMPANDVLGALLTFRCIYYFLPLFVAIGLMLLFEVRRSQKRDQSAEQ
ncbi:lysylphosphatidylglycerol synthase domain-containing protein [Egbenema bharatensis]|uniref:lysylphosphatidylglycerol synthase domain-containing protein n=1 Tax=Egbenema bharatensis TaxID=3463334 RepID=UPI003A8A1758